MSEQQFTSESEFINEIEELQDQLNELADDLEEAGEWRDRLKNVKRMLRSQTAEEIHD